MDCLHRCSTNGLLQPAMRGCRHPGSVESSDAGLVACGPHAVVVLVVAIVVEILRTFQDTQELKLLRHPYLYPKGINHQNHAVQ